MAPILLVVILYLVCLMLCYYASSTAQLKYGTSKYRLTDGIAEEYYTLDYNMKRTMHQLNPGGHSDISRVSMCVRDLWRNKLSERSLGRKVLPFLSVRVWLIFFKTPNYLLFFFFFFCKTHTLFHNIETSDCEKFPYQTEFIWAGSKKHYPFSHFSLI